MGRRRFRPGRVLAAAVLILLAGLVLFRLRYHDAIAELAESRVKSATSDLINGTIDRQISAGNIQYDRMVYFEKDLDGRITALKTNMGEVNRLKADMIKRINADILALDDAELGIPLGSLLLPEVFSGRGPQIPVRIQAIHNSDASFTSHFSEAGINQTLQRITMDIVLDVTVLVLGETDSFTVSSQVVVAETIIVGQVPETFLKTGG